MKAWLFEAPAILLLAAAFIGGIYAAATNQFGVNWATPLVLAIVLILFFIGKYFENKKDLSY